MVVIKISMLLDEVMLCHRRQQILDMNGYDIISMCAVHIHIRVHTVLYPFQNVMPLSRV